METKLNGLTLKILPDEDPIHPRRDSDNLGTILAWHRRYDFNDTKNEYETPQDFLESEEANHIYTLLPVYMLDHSGIRLSCNSFTYCDPDHWDSGQLGFIYCTEKDAKAWLGDECTPDTAKAALAEEIEVYDAYLSSDFYCFCIEDLNGDVIDSCGNFINDGNMVPYMKAFAQEEYYPLFDKLSAQTNRTSCM